MDENLITFINLVQAEDDALSRLNSEIARLEGRKKKSGSLGQADADEYDRLLTLQKAQKAGAKISPLWAVYRYSMLTNNADFNTIDIDHDEGMLQVGGRYVSRNDPHMVRIALAFGFLEDSGASVPPIRYDGKLVAPDLDHENYGPFSEALFMAIGRVAGNFSLAQAVLPILAEQGDLKTDGRHPVVSTLEFARLMNKLIKRGVKADDPHLRRHIDDGIEHVQDVNEERPYHELNISLPDLEQFNANKAVKAHVQQFAPAICAGMLQEIKAFQAVELLSNMCLSGEIAIPPSNACTILYQTWRNAPNLVSETERQSFLTRLMGPADTGSSEFLDLWNHFVSTTCTLVRDNRVDQIIRATVPAAINQQQVKKAARDLVTYMSACGYGYGHYLAIDLQKQIGDMLQLFNDPEVRRPCGNAKDPWDAIEWLAQFLPGGSRSTARYRTLATCGVIITTWLANNLDRLGDATRAMIDLKDVESPPSRLSGQTATSHPTDYDLVNACELWGADSGFSSDVMARMAEPRTTSDAPSRPSGIPSFDQLLEDPGSVMALSANGYGGRGNHYAPRGGYQGY